MLIHIGYRKTGTSWLQDKIFTNASKGFATCWGLHTGEPVEHFILQPRPKFDPKRVREEFEKASSGIGSLIPVLTHEDLSGYPEQGRYYEYDVCNRLHEAFPEAKVVIGIREQKNTILSSYKQYVRLEDGWWPLGAFLGTGHERTGFSPLCRLDHFEYDLLVRSYMDRFGRDKVLVLPLEQLSSRPLVYEQRLHDFCGTGCKAEGGIPPVNVGWRGMTLEIRRRFNKYVHKPPLWQGEHKKLSLLWRAAYKLCQKFDERAPGRWQRKVEDRLKRTVAERVGDYFKESNRRLGQLTGIDLGALGYDI